MLQKCKAGLKFSLIITFLVVAGLALWMFIFSPSPPSLNVIIYLVDALRPDHLGLYGYIRDTSPFLDELAKDGVILNNAFSLSTWTRPSIGTLFTSLYPSSHGAVNRNSILKKSVVTISEVLKNKGYKNATFVANGNIFGNGLNFDQGFDTFSAIESKTYRHGSGQEILDELAPWLKENRNSPFFLYIHTVDSHEPYFAPPYLRKQFIDSNIFTQRESQVVYSNPHISKLLFSDSSLVSAELIPTRFLSKLHLFKTIN